MWLGHHFQGQKVKGQLAWSRGIAYCGGLPQCSVVICQLKLPSARASEAGGMTPPTIYVGILILYIPLEKPNTLPCKLYATRTEMLRKAIWRLRIQENPSAAGAPWTLLRELTALPQSWWGGSGCPLPKNPISRSRPFGPRLFYPTPKLVPTPLTICHCKVV